MQQALNKRFDKRWKHKDIDSKPGEELNLFVPQGSKPRTQRQFNFFMYYNFIHSLLKVKDYKEGIEFGCGRGTISLYLDKYDGFRMTLLDISSEAIDLVKDNFERFGATGQFVIANASDTNLPDDNYDFAVSIGLLEHIPQYDKVLEEQYRVLRKGGMLISFNIPAKRSVQDLNLIYKFILTFLKPHRHIKKDYFRNKDKPGDYLAKARQIGFKNCRAVNANPFPIFTPLSPKLEPILAFSYRFIFWLRGLFLKTPLKTNYLASQGHFLICEK